MKAERWAFDRHTSAHTSPEGGGPATLAKHWANRPEGSLPSSLFTRYFDYQTTLKKRVTKPPREAHGPLQAKSLKFYSRFGSGNFRAPAKLIVAMTAI